MYSTQAIAKLEKNGKYEKITIGRGWTSEDDLDIDIKYCGFCHTDVHLANNDWKLPGFEYPAVVGHEIAGIVTKAGENVKDVKVGDHVGIGWFIDSCLNCKLCDNGEEVLCLNGNVKTATGKLLHGRIKTDNGKYTYGGFSKKITANRRFVSIIPKSYPLEKAGPVFCAGITMFTPLKTHGADKGGLNVGIMGFGGLGQMGVMIAKAMGNNVTVISTSNSKEAMAKKMGADNYIISTNPDSMKAGFKTLDLILSTISATHEVMPYLNLLKIKGTLVVLGAVAVPFKVSSLKFITDQIKITGSAVGGMKAAQECIDFIAEKKLLMETKLITNLDEIEGVETELVKGNSTGLRYVLDMDQIL